MMLGEHNGIIHNIGVHNERDSEKNNKQKTDRSTDKHSVLLGFRLDNAVENRTNGRRSEHHINKFVNDHLDGKLFANSYEWRHMFRRNWFNLQGGSASPLGMFSPNI
eukprot:13148161-Heterocapsa_arctica.AAC.1